MKRRLLAFALVLFACTPARPVASRPTSVPTILVRTLDSAETPLSAAIGGRPALVTLWATWCDACREELPALNRVDHWAREHGAVVVGVAVGEPLARISSYAAASHLPYVVLVDEDFRLADALGEKRVPTTLVVDREGRIVHTGGALDDYAIAAFRRVTEGDGGAPR